MSRTCKKGLDYFPLNVDFFEDDKIQLIEAEFGNEGLVVTMKLLCKIYKEDYFYTWGNDQSILFAKHIGSTQEYINYIVDALVQREFFDSELYYTYGILTSIAIQSRYFDAVKRYKKVDIVKEFLLVDVNDVLNANIFSINNENNDANSVEKSSGKKNKSCFYRIKTDFIQSKDENENIKADFIQSNDTNRKIKTDLMQHKINIYPIKTDFKSPKSNINDKSRFYDDKNGFYPIKADFMQHNDNENKNDNDNEIIKSTSIFEENKIRNEEKPLKEIFAELARDELWKEQMCMVHYIEGNTREIKLYNFDTLLDKFYKHLTIELQITKKSKADTLAHFGNWLRKNENKRTTTSSRA